LLLFLERFIKRFFQSLHSGNAQKQKYKYFIIKCLNIIYPFNSEECLWNNDKMYAIQNRYVNTHPKIPMFNFFELGRRNFNNQNLSFKQKTNL